MTVYYRSPQGASATLDPTFAPRAQSARATSKEPLPYAAVPHVAYALSKRATHLLGVLHDKRRGFRANRTMIALTDQALADLTGWSTRTVRRALLELEEAELIERRRSHGRRYLTRPYVLAGSKVHPSDRNGRTYGQEWPIGGVSPPIRPSKEGKTPSSSCQTREPDDDDVRCAGGEEPLKAEVTTGAEPATFQANTSAELPTALVTAELPAGALEVIALAEANPELGAAVAAEIRADAARIGREIDGNWPWFAIALCVVIVRRKAAAKGKPTRVGKPVRYAISTVLKYSALGGINQDARDAVADVERSAVARETAAPKARTAPPPPPVHTAEEIRQALADSESRDNTRRAFAKAVLRESGQLPEPRESSP